MLNDGDFIWLGVDNYFGSYLLLLHKPSLSLVAGYRMDARDSISSLAVSDESVWVGTAYGDNALLRLRKDAFLSVPRDQWVSLTITPKDRERLVQSMSNRDQALYAFFAGDDRRVVRLLGGLNPEKASLEEMFLLAWSYDVSGVDDPQPARVWFERIVARHPDSPWASYALDALKANDVAHDTRAANALALAKFDRNADGTLDAAEQRVMLRDPEFAKLQNRASEKQLRYDLEQIIQRYDRNGDSRLNQVEMAALCRSITAYVQIKQQMPEFQLRNRMLDPLLSDRVLPVDKLIAKYDKNRDSNLDVAELGALAVEIQKEKQ